MFLSDRTVAKAKSRRAMPLGGAVPLQLFDSWIRLEHLLQIQLLPVPKPDLLLQETKPCLVTLWLSGLHQLQGLQNYKGVLRQLNLLRTHFADKPLASLPLLVGLQTTGHLLGVGHQ